MFCAYILINVYLYSRICSHHHIFDGEVVEETLLQQRWVISITLLEMQDSGPILAVLSQNLSFVSTCR